jgi:hypothetical protein
MFVHARAHLAAGGAIGVFPEGTSHSGPQLKPLKTGVARIALGVRGSAPLRIVAAGLHYTAKETFRSEALVCFGEPITVEPAALDAEGEPAAEDVERLTRRIAAALGSVTLQADALEALDLAARAERILASEARESDDAPRPELAAGFDLRRRLLAGYAALRDRSPERLAELRDRILRYERRLREAGLDPWSLPVGGVATRRAALYTLLFLVRFAVLLPLGLLGLVVSYLPYRAVGAVSARVAGMESDIVATAKGLAAFLLFPLAWGALALLAAWRFGAGAGLGAGLLAPLASWAALRLSEVTGNALRAGRALVLWLVGRRHFMDLQGERRAIRAEVTGLAKELGV